ncbi:MAG TPA: TlpA family protein disulfide reductase [Acidiferrobacteraceae bacterium]|nr:TlpA family protein disulfide reductase [Acidiferrobacteraceae bacterium]
MRKLAIWHLVMVLIFPALVTAKNLNIVLKDLQGNKHNVNEYIGKGKWTVVMFWAHDCPACNAEAPHIAFFHNDHRKTDATVLGISIDGEGKLRKAQAFYDRHMLNFPNLITEPDGDLLLEFGGGMFIGTPTFYIYNPAGHFMARYIGALGQDRLEGLINRLKKHNQVVYRHPPIETTSQNQN